MLIVGVVSIVIATVAFFAATSRYRHGEMHEGNNPGPRDRVAVSTVSPGSLLVVIYTDSRGKPPEAYTTVLGILRSSTYSGMYAVAYTVLAAPVHYT